MLELAMAEKFIKKINAYTDYNVNIMNEKGIIIASRDVNRIGTFHEIAYNIVFKKLNVIEVNEDQSYLGVQSGVNLALIHNNERIGVIGITGDPKEVRPIALVMKMSMETMLEYEIQKEMIMRRRNLKENFLNYLLYEEDVDKIELENYFTKLDYKDDIFRISILCSTDSNNDPEKILEKVKNEPSYSNQDICAITKDKKIIIFKSLTSDVEQVFSNYKYIISEYLDSLLKSLDLEKGNYKFYIGTIQNNPVNYRNSYQHCQWLEKHIYTDNIDSAESFFYDYIDEYMKSIIPMIELHKIFEVFSSELKQDFKKNYIDIIGALRKNNYNLVASSKELFIHKNTLSFQFDKLKKLLNMNPVRNVKEREFMDYLYYYLEYNYR